VKNWSQKLVMSLLAAFFLGVAGLAFYGIFDAP